MVFFDDKEEVLEVQLTQYGKQLLMSGKFEPQYYAFFDEGILYDSQYGGFAENQNNAETRVRSTPSLKSQYAYTGIDTTITKNNNLIRANKKEHLQQSYEKNYALYNSLGNSSLMSEKYPAWNVQFIKGFMSSSVNYLSSSFNIMKIPQLSSSMVYNVELGQDDSFARGFYDKKYDDGSYIKIQEDYILLQVDEQNTDFNKENFDIEVFIVETVPDNKIQSGAREELKPLYFVKREEDKEDSIEALFPKLNPTFVEYYFDIECDNEINERLLNAKSKNIFLDIPKPKETQEEFDIPMEDNFEGCEE